MLSNFIIMKYINNKNNMTSAGAVIIVHFYSQGSEINTETDFLPIKSCNNKINAYWWSSVLPVLSEINL